ncbi:MAG: TIGR01777 family oxidoreductase [Planctomycetota bacterium]|jgi:uncharacterized protein (TIGR01777 family)
MRVVITGATGFIGGTLCRTLHKDYEIIALSRNTEKAGQSLGAIAKVVPWNAKTLDGWEETLDGASAVVNLAGENIASGRWTKSKKNRILRSRLDASEAIVKAIRQTEHKPNLVIQASAVGYYGTRGDQILYEDSPGGTGFLADVCKHWEQTIQPLANSPTRLAIIRLGPVLGAEGGMMQKLLPAFRLFLGGHPGSGKQWLPWIHIDDVTGAIRFLIENPALRGVFNLTSPHPAQAKHFYRLLGKLMRRPALLPLPARLLKVLMGRMARELLLSSQRVLPRRLLQTAYKFKYADAQSAIESIVKKSS